MMDYPTKMVGGHTYYPCSKCPTDCRSAEELETHMANQHGGAPMRDTGLLTPDGNPIMASDDSTHGREQEENIIGT